MTPHDAKPDPLDALLASTDAAILRAVNHALDPDVGRASIFVRTLTPDPTGALPGPGPGQPYDRCAAPAGVLHWAELIDANTRVSELLGEVAAILDRLDRLRRWLTNPAGHPHAPGHVEGRLETCATFLVALTLGVKERTLVREHACQLVVAAVAEINALQAELHADQRAPGWAWADAECRNLHGLLTTTQAQIQTLFTDGPTPVPTR